MKIIVHSLFVYNLRFYLGVNYLFLIPDSQITRYKH